LQTRLKNFTLTNKYLTFAFKGWDAQLVCVLPVKTEVICMFGIGLPELILILALALIVVAPDKLPDLARSDAKGVMDLKKTANQLKESLSEHGNPLEDIKPELEDAAKAFRDDVMMDVGTEWKDPKINDNESNKVIDVKLEHSSIESTEDKEPIKGTEKTKEADSNKQTEQ